MRREECSRLGNKKPTCAFLHNNCEFSLINYDTSHWGQAPLQLSRVILTSTIDGSRQRFIRREKGKRTPRRDTKWIVAVSSFEYRGNDGVKGGTFWNSFDASEISGFIDALMAASEICCRGSSSLVNSAKNGFKYGFIPTLEFRTFLSRNKSNFPSCIQEIVHSRNGLPAAFS